MFAQLKKGLVYKHNTFTLKQKTSLTSEFQRIRMASALLIVAERRHVIVITCRTDIAGKNPFTVKQKKIFFFFFRLTAHCGTELI